MGNLLIPVTRNIAINGDSARQVAYDDNATPYLYAADNRALAATYAVPKGVRLGNMASANKRVELLFVDQESMIGDPDLKGGIYSFDSIDFIPVVDEHGNKNGQWISEKACDLGNGTYTPLRSFNDLMREGIQIYQIADRPVYDVDSFYNDILHTQDLYAALDSAVLAGRVRWLNEERGINPIDDLVLDVPKAPIPAAHHAPKI